MEAVSSQYMSYIYKWETSQKKAICIYSILPSNGVTLNSAATLNSHTFSMETHWIVSITAMLQGVCDVFCRPPTKFSKCLHDLQPSFFYLNDSFQGEKFDALWRSFDRKLISPNMCRETQKHLLDLCMSQIFTVLTWKIWGNLR